MAKGFDTISYLNPATINCFKQSGYTFAALYIGRNLNRQLAQTLSDAGFQIVSSCERGQPTHAGYFTAQQGAIDGQRAVAAAQACRQPKGTALYAAVDYDALAHDLPAIDAYHKAFGEPVKAAGYEVGGYGSGFVLSHLLDAGLLDYVWLCGSTGYQGYHTFTEWDIKQGNQFKACGILIDSDESSGDDFGAWSLSSPQPDVPPQPPVNPQPQPQRTLKFTQPMMTGDDVHDLQTKLAARGYLQSGDVDGRYGNKTQQAVMNFQEDHGLVVDGMVGNLTRAALNEPPKAMSA